MRRGWAADSGLELADEAEEVREGRLEDGSGGGREQGGDGSDGGSGRASEDGSVGGAERWADDIHGPPGHQRSRHCTDYGTVPAATSTERQRERRRQCVSAAVSASANQVMAGG